MHECLYIRNVGMYISTSMCVSMFVCVAYYIERFQLF